MLRVYNTLGKTVQEFSPISKDQVGFYTCGPTVYDYAHIGHGRKYTYDDVIKRSLEYLGYNVKHVMNVTDVGHLVSDEDEGEDKMEKGAKKLGKTVWEVAQYFTDDFENVLKKLNINHPDVLCRATDHIPEQIEQVKKLFENGYAYDTPEAVYYDTSKFKNYGELWGQDVSKKKQAVREDVKTGDFKKNPSDFVLWFKRVGHYKDHAMHWESPWGDGFPGWHIECSAMSMKYLGDQFDIHTGGVDHIPVHHPNEIAQAEGASGKSPFVKYWIHYDFITVDGTKMSKSLGNFYRVADIVEKGIDPLALRYFFLQASHHAKQNFTWQALESAAKAYEKLVKIISAWENTPSSTNVEDTPLRRGDSYNQKFISSLEDDFNMPKALAVVWEVVKAEDMTDSEKYDLIIDFDKVLGLNLKLAGNPSSRKVLQAEGVNSDEIQQLLSEREKARENKDWKTADTIRDLLKDKFGYTVQDGKM